MDMNVFGGGHSSTHPTWYEPSALPLLLGNKHRNVLISATCGCFFQALLSLLAVDAPCLHIAVYSVYHHQS